MSLSRPKDAILNSLYVRSGGLRISDTTTEVPGTVRFNPITKTIEAYTGEDGPLGETWRELTLDIASGDKLGGVRIGSNMTIQSDGVISSIAEGVSRISQHVLTVSQVLGAGDYQTISSALTYINDLITSNDPDKPSATNSYKIVVSPGLYTETIILPDYVSLQGEGERQTIIRTTTGHASIPNSALITLGTNSILEDISLEHYEGSSSNSVGIYVSSKSNTMVKNVKITMGNLEGTAGSDVYGIYLSDCINPLFENISINITQGTSDLYGIYSSNTSPNFFNTRVIVDAPGNYNYASYHILNSNGEYRSCSLIAKGGSYNVGLKNIESMPYCHSCEIIADAEESNSRTAYGIENESTDYITSLTSSNISFVNRSSYRDDIIITGTDFITEGFENGCYIQVSGALEEKNNQTFLIDHVGEENLSLFANYEVSTESSGNTITINQFYTITLDYCVIRGTTSAITNTPSNNHYAIKATTSQLFGTYNSPQVGSGLIFYSSYQTIEVNPYGHGCYSISEALNSIQDNSEYRRYVIIVKPGIYIENSNITLKEYVNIIGSGLDNTTIKFNITSDTLASSFSVIGASNTEISDISFQNLHDSSSDNHAGVLYASSVNAMTLRRVGLKIRGTIIGNNYGIYLNGVSNITLDTLDVDVSDADLNNYGVLLVLSTVELSASEIIITGASSTGNYGIHADRSTLNMNGTKLTVSESEGTNRGINTVNASGTEYLTQFFSSNIMVSGSGNYSIYTANNQTILGGASRITGNRYYNNTSGARSIMRLHGCWNVETSSGDISYYPLSTQGVSLSSTNGNLFLGDNAGNPDITGTGNTILGTNAGSSITASNDSTLVGSEAGRNLTSGNANTLYGKKAGFSITSGAFNVMVGSSAGVNITTGDSNVGIGRQALKENTTGSRNIAIGDLAGQSSVGVDNLFIGVKAGLNAVSTSGNILIGSSSGVQSAGYGITSGNGSVIIGHQAGYTNQTGNDLVILGKQAGRLVSVGNGTFVGSYAGTSATTGLLSTMVGHKAGFSATSGDYNTLVGAQAGYNITTGGFNVIGGNKAGYSLTTGNRNVVFGAPSTTSATDSAGYSLTSGTDNIILGTQSGKSLTAGVKNVVLGVNALSTSTTGQRNIAVGYSAGASQTTQNDNIFIGYNSATSNNNTDGNLIVIGSEAGANSTCSDSILIGKESGQYSTGAYNINIGTQSGKNQSQGTGTGSSNLFIGHFSGRNIQTGSRNTGVGGGTGSGTQGILSSLTSGSDNTALGYLAGRFLTSNRNSLLGSFAGNSLVSGGLNTLIGFSAGRALTSGEGNVIAGDQAGRNLTNGVSNVFIGRDAGFTSVNASRSIAIGHSAGYSSSSGTRFVAIGHQSAYNNLSDGTIAIGYHAGRSNTTGLYNIFVGYLTGIGGIDVDTEEGTPSSMTGDYNVVMGYKAGYRATTATRNIIVGYQSAYSLTTGNQNILIGDNAGYSITSATQNVFIGTGQGDTSGPGYSTTTGGQSIMIGYEAGKANTIGSRHIYIGPQSAENATTGESNVCIGYRSGNQMIDASYNVYIGYDSGYYNTSGGSNICIGYRAGRSGTTPSSYTGVICIGRESGYFNRQDNLIAMGFQASYANTEGSGNISIGYRAGYTNQTGHNNINIGSEAGLNTVASNNIFIGALAGYTNSTGDKNISIGPGAGYSNATANNNIFMGSNAGYNTVVGNNIFFGAETGQLNSSGTRNIYFGYRAGKVALSSNNLAMGSEAGRFLTTGASNMFIGYQSGFNVSEGDSNFFIGYQSGFNTTSGSTNTFIGYQSGYSNTTGESNLYLGYQAGYYSTTGDRNLAIGYRSQRLNTTGNRNVSIGKYALYSNNYGDSNVAIGPDVVIAGDIGNNNLIIGSESAKVIKNPNFSDNIIMGYRSGLQGFAYDSSIVIGSDAGNRGAGGADNIIMGRNAGRSLGEGRSSTNSYNDVLAGFNTIYVGDFYVKKGQYLALIHEDDELAAPEIFYTVSVSSSQSTLSGPLQANLSTNDAVHLLFGEKSSVIDTATSGDSYVVVKTPKADVNNLFTIGENIILQSMVSSSYSNYSILGISVHSGSSGTGTTRIDIDSELYTSYSEGDVIYIARERNNDIGETDTSIASANIIMGTNAGRSLTMGSKNIAIGDNALRAVNSQKYNIAIGTGAGRYTNTSNNTFIGTRAGYYVDDDTNGQGKNTMIGFGAGYYTGFNSSASNNMHLGNLAGQINQGSNNIIIGCETNTMQSADAIGNTSYSDKFIIYKSEGGIPSDPIIGGDLNTKKVGIKTLNPKSSLDVAGSFGRSIESFGAESATLQYGSSYVVYWDKVDTDVDSTSVITGFPSKGNVLAGSEYIYFGDKNTSELITLVRGIYDSTPEHLAIDTYVYNIGAVKTFSNLSIEMADSGSSISINSTTHFNNSGLVVINSEIMQYAGKNGGLGKITRGIGGSSATSHNMGTTVYRIDSTSNTPINTTLTTSVHDTQTDIPFNTADFDSSGIIVINSELISYTDKTPKFFNITRASNSTSGASHTDGDVIRLVSTSTNPLTFTTLNGGITDTDEIILGNNIDDFTSSGYMIINEEVIKYNRIALRGLSRGTNDTTGVNHGTGTRIFLVSNNTSEFSVSSVLDGSINDSQTTITLDDGTGFTSSGTIVIGSEVITYTGKSGNILTGCIRGVSDNTATLHDVGDTVYKVGSYIASGTIDALSSSATVLTFISGHTDFTNSGTILTGAELITYTSLAIQNITRGVDSTLAVAHSDGSTIYNFGTLTTTKTLDGSIDDITTNVGVDSTTDLTTDGTILIGAELLTYSGGVGLSNVVRGISGTVSASHSSGSKVFRVAELAGTRSTLSYFIDLDETTLPMVDNTGYTSSGTVLIDSEVITYLNKNTLDNVSRGTNGTLSNSHINNSVVGLIIPSVITTSLAKGFGVGEDAVVLSDMTGFGSSGEIAVETAQLGPTTTREILTYQEKNKSLVVDTRGLYGTTVSTHTTSTTVYEIFATSASGANTLHMNMTSTTPGIIFPPDENPALNGYSTSGVVRINGELIKYDLLNRGAGVIRGDRGSTIATHSGGTTAYPLKTESNTEFFSFLVGDSGITTTDLAIPSGEFVNSYSGTTGYLLLDNELIEFSSKNNSLVADSNFTDSGRGTYGSSIISHNSGSVVSHIITNSNNTFITSAMSGSNSHGITATFFPLSDMSTFITSSGYARVGKEVVQYGAKNNTLEVVRGYNSSIPTTHTAGSNVYEIVVSEFSSTLGEAIDSSSFSTYLILNDTSTFDNSGNVIIQQEIINYTAKNLTMVLSEDYNPRGANGTTAVSHTSSDTTVYSVEDYVASVNLLLDIDNVQTNIPVQTQSILYGNMSSSGYLFLDNEWIKYTDDQNYIYNVARGISGTTIANHSEGITVNRIREYDNGIPLHNYETVVSNSTYPYTFSNATRGISGTTAVGYSDGASIYVIQNAHTAFVFDTLDEALLIAGTEVRISGNMGSFTDSGTVLIDSELINYTSKDSNSLNGLTRGILGTTVVDHLLGAKVFLVNDSSSIKTLTLEGNITNVSTTISWSSDNETVNSIPTTGSLLIDSEIIRYSGAVNIDRGEFDSSTNVYGRSLTGVSRAILGSSVPGAPYTPGQPAYALSNSASPLPQTSLVSGINSSVATIELTSITGFSTNSGCIMVDDEFIHYATTSGNFIKKCTRGWEYSTAGTHTLGTTVYGVRDPRIFQIDATGILDTTINYWAGNCPLSYIGSAGYVKIGSEIVSYTGTTGLFTKKMVNCTREAHGSTASPIERNTAIYYINDSNSIGSKILDGAYNATESTIFLTSSDSLNSSGYLIIDDELMRYRNRDGLELQNVVRGLLGTLPASHSDGATVYHFDTIPYRMYADTTTSDATSILIDPSTGSGIEPPSSGLYWVNNEFIYTPVLNGYSVSTFRANSSFLIDGEIIRSDSDINFTTTLIDDNIVGTTTPSSMYYAGAAQTYQHNIGTLYNISDYTLGSSTIVLDTSNNARRFPATGGYALLTRGDIYQSPRLVRFRERVNKNLNGVSVIYGADGYPSQLIYNIASNWLSADGYNDYPSKYFGTGGPTSLSSEYRSRTPLYSTLISLENQSASFYEAWVYELNPTISHSNIYRETRGTTLTSITAGKSIKQITSSASTILTTALDNSVGNVDIAVNESYVFGTSGFILIEDELLTYNESAGIKNAIRGQLSSTATSHTANSSGYYQYKLDVSNATTLRIDVSDTDLNIPLTSTVGFNNSTGIYVMATTGITPEVFTRNIIGDTSFLSRSLDNLTRGAYGTIPVEHPYEILMSSNICIKLDSVDAYSTLKENISIDTKFVPTVDGSSYSSSFSFIIYLLIGSEFMGITSRRSIDNLTRGVFDTTASAYIGGISGPEVYCIIQKSDYSTLAQDITEDHQFLPLVDASSYSSSGVVLVNGEWISYFNKNSFDGLTRGLLGTSPSTHTYNIGDADQFVVLENINPNETLRLDMDTSVIYVALNNDNGIYEPQPGKTAWILVDGEIMLISSLMTADNITRGFLGTTATSHDANDDIYIVSASGHSTLRTNMTTITPHIPLNSATSYQTTGIGLVDAEFFDWTSKNTLDVLSRGLYGSSESTHPILEETLITNITNPSYVIPNFQLTSNKVLLSDDVSGIKIDSTSDFPDSGTILIGTEKIEFGTKTVLADANRETNATNATTHDDGTRVYLIASEQSPMIALGASSLTTDLTENATVITLDDASPYSSPGTVIIDAEIITFNSMNGNNLTRCVRGKLGTTPATHESGSKVLSINDTAIYTTLDGDMTVNQRIIPVIDNTNFGTSGTVLINAEIITYKSKTALGKLTRGADSTTAVSYPNTTPFVLSDITIGDSHSTVLLNSTDDNITADLPESSTVSGRIYTFKKSSSDSNLVILSPYESETIDGNSVIVSTVHNAFITIQSDGANWKTIGHSSNSHWSSGP
jgi:hypothetical protein